jgi:hypothetical protein
MNRNAALSRALRDRFSVHTYNDQMTDFWNQSLSVPVICRAANVGTGISYKK